METIYDWLSVAVFAGLALLYLHHHPEIDLIGITTVFGNASVDVTTRKARFLARIWGIKAPVHAGVGERLVSSDAERKYPVHIHGENGLGGYPVRSDARWERLRDELRAHA